MAEPGAPITVDGKVYSSPRAWRLAVDAQEQADPSGARFASSSPLAKAVATVAPDPRAQTVAFWTSKGAPPHVAEGIADRVQAESGFNPTVPGDKGTSIGLYQHHADRKAALMQRPNWQNPLVQHQHAYSEVTGGDPIATKHWAEILAAPDRATAAKLWDKYFERSAGGVQAGQQSAGGAGQAAGRRMPGRFGGMGPLVPGGDDAPAPAVAAPSGLRRALTAAEAPGVPIQVAPAAAAPAVAAPSPPLQLAPIAPIQAPNLRQGYADALSAILAGRRRPFGSMFG
ncbi:MAG TPA: phage tail tip lysozyme [Ramlibacter sp.]|nr:phage tail tip lysozyme [Ramlibacter sp.]